MPSAVHCWPYHLDRGPSCFMATAKGRTRAWWRAREAVHQQTLGLPLSPPHMGRKGRSVAQRPRSPRAKRLHSRKTHQCFQSTGRKFTAPTATKPLPLHLMPEPAPVRTGAPEETISSLQQSCRSSTDLSSTANGGGGPATTCTPGSIPLLAPHPRPAQRLHVPPVHSLSSYPPPNPVPLFAPPFLAQKRVVMQARIHLT